MMTLADAASFFDRTPVLNPDTDAQLFLGQIDPYDDSRRDSLGAYRRIMSVAPGTTVPVAVKALGVTYLIGNKEVDGLEVRHRDKYVLQQASAKASIHRLAGYLSSTVSSQAWAAASWDKDGKEQEISDAALQVHELFVPLAADVRTHDIITLSGRTYIVHAARPGAVGLQMVSCYLLEHALAAATINARVYDPVAGAYTGGGLTTPNCLRVRWQFLFRYDSQEDVRFAAGDAAFVLPAATSVTTADRFALAGANWKILSVDAIDGGIVVHGRPS